MTSDIVDRLRRWTHAVDSQPASDLMDEAAGEIERLRLGALASRESVRLTDAEREAVEYVAHVGRAASEMDRQVLRGLLGRMSPLTT